MRTLSRSIPAVSALCLALWMGLSVLPSHAGTDLSSEIQEFTLDNGMRVLVLERPFSPTFAGYYQFHYVDVLGLAVVLLATINIVYGIWDIANNPLAGYLSDSKRARWGRRRWLLAALPFVLVILVLAYDVPEPFRQGSALFWYALVIVFLFETAATVMFVNYSVDHFTMKRQT